ncbi:MAG: hypothetical protein JF586_13300 [Burkholderiales bacterium]|nr:hypothetical protein [Burkholderiales bacterium]
MPYVRRDLMGRIESVHRTSAADAVEYLDAGDPELKRFLQEEFGAPEPARAGLQLLPVFEEVLQVLLAKGLVTVEELSENARATWAHVLEARQPPADATRFSASGFVEIIDDSAFGGLPDQR